MFIAPRLLHHSSAQQNSETVSLFCCVNHGDITRGYKHFAPPERSRFAHRSRLRCQPEPLQTEEGSPARFWRSPAGAKISASTNSLL